MKVVGGWVIYGSPIDDSFIFEIIYGLNEYFSHKVLYLIRDQFLTVQGYNSLYS